MLISLIISAVACTLLFAAVFALMERVGPAGASTPRGHFDLFCAGAAFGLAPLIALQLVQPPATGGASYEEALWGAGFCLFFFSGVCSVQIIRRYRLNPMTLMAAAIVYALLAVAGLLAVLIAEFDRTRVVVGAAAVIAAPFSFFIHWLLFSGRRLRLARFVVAGAALSGAMTVAAQALGPVDASGVLGPERLSWWAVWAVLMFMLLRPAPQLEAAEADAPARGSVSVDDLPDDLIAYVVDEKGEICGATAAAHSFFRFDLATPQGRKAPVMTMLSPEKGGYRKTGASPACSFTDRAGVTHFVRVHERGFGARDGERRLIVAELIDDFIAQQEQWRRLKSRMISVVDANDDLLLFISGNGLVADLNRAALHFLKKARKDSVGAYVWTLFPESEASLSAAAWRNLLAGAQQEESATADAVFENGEGEARLFSLTVSRIPNEERGAPEFVCYGRDVTEVTQARKSFRDARARLEQTIASRTRELQDAKRAADEANLSKSRFLANMSHELRTPLNAILGYTDLMRQDLSDEGKKDSQEYQDLDRVIINARNLLNLINDILDLSKVEANKMTLSYGAVEVEDFLDDLRASADPLVMKRNNTFIIDADPALKSMTVDRQKVSQCLLNLLSNAAKFTENGEIALKLWRTEEEGETAPMICFEVRDTGKGMTEAQCAAIFDEFVQVEDKDGANAGGTGLGLPISKRFCQLMGGDIAAVSAPGKGSRFTMWVRDGEADAAGTREDAA